MKYYKLGMDMDRKNDIVCHCEDDCGIHQNAVCIGKTFEGWDGRFNFFYDKSEGYIQSDYLANDKGWFVVSEKLKKILEDMNTEIQFLPVKVVSKHDTETLNYYVANILRVVDALCLKDSEYFRTEIPELGNVYTVSKFSIYENKTEDSDVFKLGNRQEIPIFVSERFKKMLEAKGVTGIMLKEIRVA